MRPNTVSTPDTLLRALQRGVTVAGLAAGLICAAPSTAEATQNECTQVSTGVLVLDVSYNGNFYSQDGGIWVGGMDPWEIASDVGVTTGTVDVLFNFYSAGTLTVDLYDYDYVAGDSLLFTFDIDDSYYVGANADLERALLPLPPMPKEPDGPLPQNEVIISPKTSCTAS